MTTENLSVAALVRHAGRLWLAWVLALFALAVLFGVAGAGQAIRAGLGDPGLRANVEGLGAALRILAHNLPVAASILCCAYFVPRHPRWRMAADVYIGAAAVLALVAGAASIAAFQVAVVRYAIAFGPVEIAGFALSIATYRTARHLPPRSTTQLMPASVLVLVVLSLAALLEAVFGGTV